jgi:hypothetical protein
MSAGFLCKRDFFPFAKEKNRAAWPGEEQRLFLEGQKIPAHMTRANVLWETKVEQLM